MGAWVALNLLMLILPLAIASLELCRSLAQPIPGEAEDVGHVRRDGHDTAVRGAIALAAGESRDTGC